MSELERKQSRTSRADPVVTATGAVGKRTLVEQAYGAKGAAALPAVAEASIGHELTADALVMGFAEAVRAYKAALGG